MFLNDAFRSMGFSKKDDTSKTSKDDFTNQKDSIYSTNSALSVTPIKFFRFFTLQDQKWDKWRKEDLEFRKWLKKALGGDNANGIFGGKGGIGGKSVVGEAIEGTLIGEALGHSGGIISKIGRYAGKAGRFALKGGAILGGGYLAKTGADLIRDNKDKGFLEGGLNSKATGYATSVAGGALAGAEIGSVIPGIGTTIGAGVGAGIGYANALYNDDPKFKKMVDDNFSSFAKTAIQIGERGNEAWNKIEVYSSIFWKDAKPVMEKFWDAAKLEWDLLITSATKAWDNFSIVMKAFGDVLGPKITKFISFLDESTTKFSSWLDSKTSGKIGDTLLKIKDSAPKHGFLEGIDNFLSILGNKTALEGKQELDKRNKTTKENWKNIDQTISNKVTDIGNSAKSILPDDNRISYEESRKRLQNPTMNAQNNYDSAITPSNVKGGKDFLSSAPGLMDYYINKYNLKPEQAAGIIGNFQQESPGLKADVHEINPLKGKGGYGIAQFTGAKYNELTKFAKDNNLDISKLETQQKFLDQDKDFLKQMDHLKKIQSGDITSLSTQSFSSGYEKPGIPNMGNRVSYADQALKAWKDAQNKIASSEMQNERRTPPPSLMPAASMTPPPSTSMDSKNAPSVGGMPNIKGQPTIDSIPILDQDLGLVLINTNLFS